MWRFSSNSPLGAEAGSPKSPIEDNNERKMMRQSLGKSGQRLLSPAPQSLFRATITADSHGIVLSANQAVLEIFGRTPEELIDTSVRGLLHFMAKNSQRKKIGTQLSETRFSRTDMWKDLMHDLTSVRVVNGKRSDGTMVPLLLSSSEMRIGGQLLYSLLFEPIRNRNGAVVTTCHEGIVQTASPNVLVVFGMAPRAMCGESLRSFFEYQEDPIERSLMMSTKNRQGQKHVLGAPVDMVLEGDDWLPVVVEVIDSRNGMYVVTIRPGEISDMARKQPRSINFDPEAFKTEKGGIDPDAVVDEEEIGYYTVSGALGVGQCGMVRKGMHRTTGISVAVKTLKKSTFDEVGLAWPGRELNLMRYLRHPNIVQLYDCVSGDDRMYLVLELVSGGELLSYCYDKGPIEEEEARGYFRDILGAVDYLARKGIVHRDLKLENCLLTLKQRVKIIDFGLANFYVSGNLKTSCGSADYAAPELFTASQYYGPPVDVWAMGVMLYSMVAGEFPFDDVQATLEADYTWPLNVSRSLEGLLSEMFEMNPDLRLNVEQIRRNDWVNMGFSGPTDRPQIEGQFRPLGAADAADSGEVRRDVLNVRLDILVLLEQEYGFATEAVVESLMGEDINQFTAAYKMLLVKHRSEYPCNEEDVQRARVIVADMRKQRDIGSISQDLDLSKIKVALKDRHRKSDMASALRHRLSSVPTSPRGSENKSDSENELAQSTAALADRLEALEMEELRPREITNKILSPAVSRNRAGTRERSTTYGGTASSTPPMPVFRGKSPEGNAGDGRYRSDSVETEGSSFEEPLSSSMERLPTVMNAKMQRQTSRGNLTGGRIGTLWKQRSGKLYNAANEEMSNLE